MPICFNKNEVILMGFFSGDSVCYPLFFYVAVHVSHDFLNNFCNMHNMDENGSSGIIHNIDGTCVRYQGIIFAIDLDKNLNI